MNPFDISLFSTPFGPIVVHGHKDMFKTRLKACSLVGPQAYKKELHSGVYCLVVSYAPLPMYG